MVILDIAPPVSFAAVLHCAFPDAPSKTAHYRVPTRVWPSGTSVAEYSQLQAAGTRALIRDIGAWPFQNPPSGPQGGRIRCRLQRSVRPLSPPPLAPPCAVALRCRQRKSPAKKKKMRNGNGSCGSVGAVAPVNDSAVAAAADPAPAAPKARVPPNPKRRSSSTSRATYEDHWKQEGVGRDHQHCSRRV